MTSLPFRRRHAGRRAGAAALTALGALTLAAVPTGPSGAVLDRDHVRKVTPAVVQLGPIFTVPNKETNEAELRSFGWGSGTILNSDGYILTNAHVTDTSDLVDEAAKAGGVVKEGVLAVYVTRRTDQPPVPAFVARVIATDTDLDLAVIKITVNLNGTPVDFRTVDLPSVDLGDSDGIELADTLNVFGYPGIGGETITYTVGPVSGFASDRAVPGRAWIKTSTSISGGNSGGAGIDDQGLLVGVPTRTGVNGADSFVDCRLLADTNRDGTIDDRDTCIPTGGFLNSLRAVNVGKPFIAAALKAEVPPTPSMTPDALGPTAPAAPSAVPPLICLPGVAEPGCPAADPAGVPDSAPDSVPGTDVDAVPGTDVDAVPGSDVDAVPGTDVESVPDSAPDSVPGTDADAVPGTDADPVPAPPASGGSSTVGKQVDLIGSVIDADTGRAVAGIQGYVLVEGVTWADAKDQSDIYATAISDRNGDFRFNKPVRRGVRYSIGFGATGSGYRPVTADNVLIPTSGPDPLVLDVQLEQE